MCGWFFKTSSFAQSLQLRFWRCLREMCGNCWINNFKDMVHLGLLDTSDLAQIECVRYCFLPVITRDLNRVLQHWNEHTIRRSRNTECPSGKPDVLYFQHEIYRTKDFKMLLPDNLDVVEQEHSSYPLLVVCQWSLKLLKEILQNKMVYIIHPTLWRKPHNSLCKLHSS